MISIILNLYYEDFDYLNMKTFRIKKTNFDVDYQSNGHLTVQPMIIEASEELLTWPKSFFDVEKLDVDYKGLDNPTNTIIQEKYVINAESVIKVAIKNIEEAKFAPKSAFQAPILNDFIVKDFKNREDTAKNMAIYIPEFAQVFLKIKNIIEEPIDENLKYRYLEKTVKELLDKGVKVDTESYKEYFKLIHTRKRKRYHIRYDDKFDYADKAKYITRGYNIDETKMFYTLMNDMLEEKYDSVEFEHRVDDGLLGSIKEVIIKHGDPIKNKTTRTYAFHLCEFLQKLAMVLFTVDLYRIRQGFVHFDTCGYENFFIMIYGGKHDNEMLPRFRLFFEPLNSARKFYTVNGDSYYDRGKYIYTAPLQWHQNFVLNLFSLPSKFASNMFSIINRGVDPKFSIYHLLLALNGRRQLEGTVHNLRYLLVAPFGTYQDLVSVAEDTLPKPVCPLTAFINFRIIRGYAEYFKHAKDSDSMYKFLGVKDVFTGCIINNTYAFTCVVYSTYLMNYGTYRKNQDQRINLIKVFKQKEECNLPDIEVKDNITYMNGISSETYMNERFADEGDCWQHPLSFNWRSCMNLGRFLSAYFNFKECYNDLYQGWSNIKNESWTSVATTTGMRFRRDNWKKGSKGYDIVLEDVKSELEFFQKFELDNPLDANKLYNDYKRGLIHKILEDEIELDQMYDQVDKSQRALWREIYVMAYYTKLLQQPLEKMFGLMCRKLENESISEGSDVRAFNIHGRMFSEVRGTHEHWVMDCKRWGPLSSLGKYLYFIKGIQHTLPPDFVRIFYSFWYYSHHKIITISKSLGDQFINHQSLKNYWNKYINETDEYSYFHLPYSWVMGIFNYLSSLMHATQQLYFNNILTMHGFRVEFHASAHSDDSAANLIYKQQPRYNPFILYENFSKLHNHMMSKKKLCLGSKYFEYLSILYLFQEFLPLAIKFTSNFVFSTTCRGYARDVEQSIQQSLQARKYGADYCESYYIMKFTTLCVNKFHEVKRLNACSKPIFLMGEPDSHPLCYELIGYFADLMNIKENKNKIYAFMSLMTDVMEGCPTIKKQNQIHLSKHVKELYEFFNLNEDWDLKNYRGRNHFCLVLSLPYKVHNLDFAEALSSVSAAKRFYWELRGRKYDLYEFRNQSFTFYDLINFIDYNLRYEEVEVKLPDFKRAFTVELKDITIADWDSYIHKLYGPAYDTLEEINNYNVGDILVENDLVKYKPVKWLLPDKYIGLSHNINPIALVSHLKGLRPWIHDANYTKEKYDKAKITLSYFIDPDLMSNIDWLPQIFNILSKQTGKIFYSYSRTKNLGRNINNFDDLVDSMRMNTFNNMSLKLIQYKSKKVINRYEFDECCHDYMNFLELFEIIGQINLKIEFENIIFNVTELKEYLEYRINKVNDWQLHVMKPIITGNLPEMYLHWRRSQVKHGEMWYGLGKIHIQMLNSLWELETDRNRVISIKLDGEPTVEEVDYLFERMFLRWSWRFDHDIIWGEHVSEKTLGFDTSGRIIYGYPNEMHATVRGVHKGDIPKLNFTQAHHTKRGIWVTDKGKIFPLIESDKYLDEFVDKLKVVESEMKEPDLITKIIISKLSSKTRKRLDIEREELCQNFANSLLRRTIPRQGDSYWWEGVNSAISEGQIQGTPLTEEVDFVKAGLSISSIPDEHIETIKRTQYLKLKPSAKLILKADMEQIMRIPPTEWERSHVVQMFMNRWGKEKLEEMSLSIRKRSFEFFETMRFIGYDDINAPIYADAANFVLNYIKDNKSRQPWARYKWDEYELQDHLNYLKQFNTIYETKIIVPQLIINLVKCLMESDELETFEFNTEGNDVLSSTKFNNDFDQLTSYFTNLLSYSDQNKKLKTHRMKDFEYEISKNTVRKIKFHEPDEVFEGNQEMIGIFSVAKWFEKVGNGYDEDEIDEFYETYMNEGYTKLPGYEKGIVKTVSKKNTHKKKVNILTIRTLIDKDLNVEPEVFNQFPFALIKTHRSLVHQSVNQTWFLFKNQTYCFYQNKIFFQPADMKVFKMKIFQPVYTNIGPIENNFTKMFFGERKIDIEEIDILEEKKSLNEEEIKKVESWAMQMRNDPQSFITQGIMDKATKLVKQKLTKEFDPEAIKIDRPYLSADFYEHFIQDEGLKAEIRAMGEDAYKLLLTNKLTITNKRKKTLKVLLSAVNSGNRHVNSFVNWIVKVVEYSNTVEKMDDTSNLFWANIEDDIVTFITPGDIKEVDYGNDYLNYKVI